MDLPVFGRADTMTRRVAAWSKETLFMPDCLVVKTYYRNDGNLTCTFRAPSEPNQRKIRQPLKHHPNTTRRQRKFRRLGRCLMASVASNFFAAL
jgi:hypothetical protein